MAKETDVIIRDGNGKFWTFVADDFVYVAVDNSTGDCLVEEFPTFSECRAWLG